MDEAWIGRRLMQAARALAQRLEDENQTPAAGFVAAVAAPLIREVGRSLMLGDTNPTGPLLRARVLWRLPTTVSHRELAIAFNALGTLVRGHVRDLPGISVPIDRFVLDALRHAARTLLCLRHTLVQGLPAEPYERAFGGLLLIEDAVACPAP